MIKKSRLYIYILSSAGYIVNRVKLVFIKPINDVVLKFIFLLNSISTKQCFNMLCKGSSDFCFSLFGISERNSFNDNSTSIYFTSEYLIPILVSLYFNPVLRSNAVEKEHKHH